jgi:hypothetical protein
MTAAQGARHRPGQASLEGVARRMGCQTHWVGDACPTACQGVAWASEAAEEHLTDVMTVSTFRLALINSQ